MDMKIKEAAHTHTHTHAHTHSTYKEKSVNQERNYKYYRPTQEKILKKGFIKIRYGETESGKLLSCGKKSFKNVNKLPFQLINMAYIKYPKK